MRPSGAATQNLNILVRGFRNMPVAFDTIQ
jgi:hypothetical protein